MANPLATSKRPTTLFFSKVRSLLAVITLLGIQAGCPARAENTSGTNSFQDSWTNEVEKLVRDEKGDEAIKILDQQVKANPKSFGILHLRACTYFRLGKIDECMKDFDQVAEMAPKDFLPNDWQRGIALYYAKRYTDGRKQFELHQTVNPNDVENSAWHFLCVAKESGLEEARKVLIPSGGDARAPMMEVLKLFHGDIKPEDVISAAEKSRQASARFYGYLYVGLYYDAVDNTEEADKWLKKCIDTGTGGYMRDCAVVHLKLRPASK